MQQRRTRVKICGITRPEDAAAAVAAGADAIGLVFYEPSPRYVSLDTAAAICDQLPPFVCPVGLFVDAGVDQVREAVSRLPLGLLQFHGEEPPDYCEQFGRPYIKALRMRADTDVDAALARWNGARALLLDTYRKGTPGGTGEAFNWDWIPARLAPRVVLAGGLNPDNISAAIAAVRPFAVDVSGGVESAPGRKETGKIRAFAEAVARADAAVQQQD